MSGHWYDITAHGYVFGQQTAPGQGGGIHDGYDVLTPQGTPITALIDGTVGGETGQHPYGWRVDILGTLPDGRAALVMVIHLDSISVSVGQQVKRGDTLGISGGENLPLLYSTGPHTHVGVFVGGVAVDPLPLLEWNRRGGIGLMAGVDTTGLGSGFAQFATAHGLHEVSAGEHEYAAGETFAAFAPTPEFPTGAILYYNAKTGELTAGKAPWVATALWQQLDAAQARAATLTAENDKLKQQLQAANTPTPIPDAYLKAKAAIDALKVAWTAVKLAMGL